MNYTDFLLALLSYFKGIVSKKVALILQTYYLWAHGIKIQGLVPYILWKRIVT